MSHPSEEGLTCCQVTQPPRTFDQRLDLVLYRGLDGVGQMDIVGEEPADRTATGLWPSDHAAIVAELSERVSRYLKPGTPPLLNVDAYYQAHRRTKGAA